MSQQNSSKVEYVDKVLYMSGETPQPGDRIYAGDGSYSEDFVTVVREIKGAWLTTAGWPESTFPIKQCAFVERGDL